MNRFSLKHKLFALAVFIILFGSFAFLYTKLMNSRDYLYTRSEILLGIENHFGLGRLETADQAIRGIGLAKVSLDLIDQKEKERRIIGGILESFVSRSEVVNDIALVQQFGIKPLNEIADKKIIFETPEGVVSPPYYGTDLSAGDMDGDGIGDLLVGRIPVFKSAQTNCAFMFLSTRVSALSEPSNDSDVELISVDLQDWLPPEDEITFNSKSSVGEICLKTDDMFGTVFGQDVDGDGRADAMIGRNGRAVLSRTLSNYQDIDKPYELDSLPSSSLRSFKLVDDFDNDGIGDILVRANKKVRLLSAKSIFESGASENEFQSALDDATEIAVLPNVGFNRMDFSFYSIPDLDNDQIPEIATIDKNDEFEFAQIFYSADNFTESRSPKITFSLQPKGRGGHEIRLTSIGDFDGDGVADFWLQDPVAYKAYLITAESVRGSRDNGAEIISIDDIADFVVSSENSVSNHGLLGYTKTAADFNGDNLLDFVFTNADMFDGRGALFALSGAVIRNSETRQVSIQDPTVVGYAPYDNPISWLSPIEIGGPIDMNKDGVPDIMLGADYDLQGGIGAGAIYIVDGAKLGKAISDY